jgi:SAM-dependent methyltransferase
MNALMSIMIEVEDSMSKNYVDIIAELYDYCPFFSKFNNNSNYIHDFYLPIIDANKVENILELGSATGNLTIPIIERGIALDSVDISKDMHDIIRNKISNRKIKIKNSLNLITDNVFDIKLNKKYDMVIMPDNFISAMSSYEEQSNLISLAKKALKNNGLLVFDASPPSNKFLVGGKKHNFVCRTRTPLKKLYIVECEIFINEDKQQTYQNFNISRLDKNLNILEQYKTQIVFKYLKKDEILEILNSYNFEIIEAKDEIVKDVKEYAFVAKAKGEI